jgi:hypothetical protein
VQRDIRPVSRAFARATRAAESPEEVRRLALEALDRYFFAATMNGSNAADSYYASLYEEALVQAGALQQPPSDDVA